MNRMLLWMMGYALILNCIIFSVLGFGFGIILPFPFPFLIGFGTGGIGLFLATKVYPKGKLDL